MSKILKAIQYLKLNNTKIAKNTIDIISKKNVKIYYISKLKNLSNLEKNTIRGLYIPNTNYIYINSNQSITEMASSIVHEIDHLKRSRNPRNDFNILSLELLAYRAEMELKGDVLDKKQMPNLIARITNDYRLFTNFYTGGKKSNSSGLKK
jgi:uncharacterized protein YjaZ